MFSQSFYESDLSFLKSQTNYNLKSNSFQLAKKTITENQIILDVLYMLLGMPCSILTKKNSSDQYQLNDKYQLTHLTNTTLKNALQQSIKMCNQTKYIQTQTNKLYKSSKNAIIKTFCQSIFNYLQQTKKYFSNILSQINSITKPLNGKITILNLREVIKSRKNMLQFIIRCLNTCFIAQERKPQSVRLLDKIWEIQQQLLNYAQFDRNQFIKICKRTLQIYFNNIKDWLSMKKISQSMQFFITIQQNNKNLPEHFLYQNQQLQLTKLPKITQSQSKAILEIGKTIKFISLYYQDYQQQKLMKYLNIDEQFEILDQILECKQVRTFQIMEVQKISLNQRIKNKRRYHQRVNKKMEEKVQDNPYEMFNKDCNMFGINWIQKRQKIITQNLSQVNQQAKQKPFQFLCYTKCILLQILQNINKKCLQFIKNDFNPLAQQINQIKNQRNRIQTSLSHTLIGIQKFMLLFQGDFLQQFFNAAQQIIDKQKAEVSHNKIYYCIDQAIQNSSVRKLPKQILNNLHFDFLKPPDKRGQRLKLWVLFCFNYRQDGPINFIFNTNIMQKLKQICNMIIKLKKSQLVLIKIWNYYRQQQQKQLNNPKTVKKQKILCNSLLTFLNNCLNYLFLKLSISFNQYRQKLQKISTIFDIVSQTNQLITQLQKYTISDKLFYNSTMQSLLIVEKYRKLHNMIKDVNIIIPVTEIQQLQFQLRSVIQIIGNIPELNQIVNFNGFFDRFQ